MPTFRPKRKTQTTHIRISTETRNKLNAVAKRWGCAQNEAVRWLTELAHEGKVCPQEAYPDETQD